MALYKNVGKNRVLMSADEEAAVRAEWAVRQMARADARAFEEAKKSARAQALAETPSNVNSVPALRAEIDKIKEVLKELVG